MQQWAESVRLCQQEEQAGLKGKWSETDMRQVQSSSVDVDSHSDDGHHSIGGQGPPAKRCRKIPKLPMVRHGKKWYRARLLKDTGSRVQIGECDFSYVFPCLEDLGHHSLVGWTYCSVGRLIT